MVKVSYPLKQGLKLNPCCFLNVTSMAVKVSYPLKQGLKRCYLASYVHWEFVKVSYPLKQGLKHYADQAYRNMIQELK